MLTRWSGRPKTMATAISAGASSSATSSSVGLSVNRMTTEPTSPMTDDSSEVVVWVSIVRIERHVARAAATPAPRPGSGVEVERERHEAVEQLAAHLGDDPLPDDAEEVRLDEAAQRLGEEQDDEPDDQPVERRRVPAGDDRGDEPGDHERHQQRQPRPEHEADEREAERAQVRAQVPEQAAPRHAGHDPDPAGDLARRSVGAADGLHARRSCHGTGRATPAPPGGSAPAAEEARLDVTAARPPREDRVRRIATSLAGRPGMKRQGGS